MPSIWWYLSQTSLALNRCSLPAPSHLILYTPWLGKIFLPSRSSMKFPRAGCWPIASNCSFIAISHFSARGDSVAACVTLNHRWRSADHWRSLLQRRWESHPWIPHPWELIVQALPSCQCDFGDMLRPVASIHVQVTSQDHPILVTTSLASEALEIDCRPMTPQFDVRLVVALWVWVWVAWWHLGRSAYSRSLYLQHLVLCTAFLFWIPHFWSGDTSWPMGCIQSTT